ncbi:hypothetical protein HDU97_007092 [Phlyctochytrium planicorne]|nr:hypothetical protein HDU97_007092 [Phlyctochytrium planicorne]
MKLSIPSFLTLIALGLATANPIPSSKPSIDFASLEAEIEQLRKDTNSKGAVVGLVINGKLEYKKGFGFRNTKNDKVTDKTLFQIGSNTKAFTAVLVSMLAEEGKVDFDAPVTKYASGLAFLDPNVTEYATLTDIMSHRTGLPRHDLMTGFWNSTADIISHIKYLDPVAPFRTEFHYNNIMFILAGTIAGQANDNKGWHASIKEKILDKLGMRNTYTDIYEAYKDNNMAQGFSEDGGLLKNEDSDKWLNVNSPAGSIAMDIHDAAKWVSFLQTQGVTRHGKRLLSQSTFDDRLWAHNTFVSNASRTLTFPAVETNQYYGLGFIPAKYRGDRVICHGGATFGFLSQICTFPAKNTTLIVLTNSQTPAFYSTAINIMKDRILYPDATKLDWTNESKAIVSYMAAAKNESIAKLEALKQTGSAVPSLPLAAYTGTFVNQGYGQAHIALSPLPNANLTLTTNLGITAPLIHWVNDTFASYLFGETTPSGLARFVVDSDKVVEVALDLEPELGKPTSFLRDDSVKERFLQHQK